MISAVNKLYLILKEAAKEKEELRTTGGVWHWRKIGDRDTATGMSVLPLNTSYHKIGTHTKYATSCIDSQV